MRISNISTNYFIKNHIHNDITKSTNQQKLRFEGAKDLHLKYILKKRAHLLPERILNKIKEITVAVMPCIKR